MRSAIGANPEKSGRAIAADLGINQSTVSRARSETGDACASPERVGRDGKSYPVKSEMPTAPRRGKDATRERVLEALVILSGLPPASEVANYFADADTAILISPSPERSGCFDGALLAGSF
jgi:hypothetical protein